MPTTATSLAALGELVDSARARIAELSGELQRLQTESLQDRHQVERQTAVSDADRLQELQAEQEARRLQLAAQIEALDAQGQRWLGFLQRARQNLRRALQAEAQTLRRDLAIDAEDAPALAAQAVQYESFSKDLRSLRQRLEADQTRLERLRRRLGAVPAVVTAPPPRLHPQLEPLSVLQRLGREEERWRGELDGLDKEYGRLLPRLGAWLLRGVIVAAALAGAWFAHQAGQEIIVVAGIGMLAVIALAVQQLFSLRGRQAGRRRWLEVHTGFRPLPVFLDQVHLRGEAVLHPQTVVQARVDALLDAEAAARAARDARRQAIEQELVGVDQRHRRAEAAARQRIDLRLQQLRRELAGFDATAASQRSQTERALATRAEGERHRLESQYREQRQTVRAEIDEQLQQIIEACDTAWQAGRAPAAIEAWLAVQDPQRLPEQIPLGHLQIDPAVWLDLPRAEWPELPELLQVPLAVTFSPGKHLLLGAATSQAAGAAAIQQQALLRHLLSGPPAATRASLIDPLQLGSSFQALAGLLDGEPSAIGPRIWSDATDIEEHLQGLCVRIEQLTQKCLRGRYPDLAAFNAEAGELSEPYHVLGVADFPRGFSARAIGYLQTLLVNGPRCGVLVWLHRRPDENLPAGLTEVELQQQALCLEVCAAGWRLASVPWRNWQLQLFPLPPADAAQALVSQINARQAAAGRVAVPLTRGLPTAAERWGRSCASELRLPLGLSGVDRMQELRLGRGTAQHVLISGRTGSGKSTLLHVLIAGACSWYSADELNLYLIDFKRGVEFKFWADARPPHARVVALESDRDFALSCLRAFDAELASRGAAFRAASVQDLAAYRVARPDAVMPRLLLVVDEFHEFFSDDDALARDAALLLDRFVRQGRAFGMHVILGSQTLGGVYALARSSMGQMGVRIALQCDAADASLILREDNDAAHLLARPGEAIYNDRAGLREGNQHFQIFWCEEEELQAVARQARGAPQRPGTPPAVIFEGNQPAQLRDNQLLRTAAAGTVYPVPIWLGEPNAIKEPTAVSLGGEAGSGLIIVGQNQQAAIGMQIAAAVALLRQYQPGGLRLYWVSAGPGDEAFTAAMQELERSRASQDCQRLLARGLPDLVNGLREGDVGVPVYLLIHGLERLP